MCDAFLVTAQTAKGLSCFFVPRWTPEGRLNEMRIQRFKDKLGDRSNAGTEMEFWGSLGWLVGEEGRGIPTVLEMGVYTRLDCAIGSTGIMRGALSQAMHHASLRAAFGKLLKDQPLMRNVLADMALEVEAATALSMRLARAFDAQQDEGESLLRRILTPVAKYWICKRCPTLVGRGHGSARRQRLRR
jgi:putative acyl-CoA dehydrogenase